MSATRVEADMREFEDLMDLTIHFFPNDPAYRLSGCRHPQPGDIALCGHVKVRPYSGAYVNTRATCAGCATLRGLRS